MASRACGIVGMPNVGKSTLFNALTRTQLAQAANFPFCTIEVMRLCLAGVRHGSFFAENAAADIRACRCPRPSYENACKHCKIRDACAEAAEVCGHRGLDPRRINWQWLRHATRACCDCEVECKLLYLTQV